MQFTILALSALSIGSAFAQTVHVVKVGSANGTLAFAPNNVVAAQGDMIQFQFAPQNHSVVQSTFDNPCLPISSATPGVQGIFSGYMPVQASAAMTPTYTIMVADTKPMWLYCSQAKHCQNGMTMVINENVKANASRTLAAYQALAKVQTQNLAPSTTATNGTAGVSSGSSTGTGAKTSSTPGAASSVKASGSFAMAGLLAAGMALFI